MGINEKAWHVGFKWTIGDEDNPTGAICLDDSSDALHICEIKDARTDWAVSTTSHPTLYVHSASDPATDYVRVYHDGTNGIIDCDGTTVMSMTATTLDIAGDLGITGDVTVTGGVTWTGAVDVVLTAPTTADDAFYGLINASAVYTAGNMVGLRGKVVLSGTTNFVSATGVWAGLDFSTKTGSGSGLTCALNAEVTSDNATAPNAIVYLQSLPNGSSADFSNVPFIAFTEYAASGTGSNILFSLGHQPAGSNRNVTSGTSGNIIYQQTLHIIANGSDAYIPYSTVEGTYTTAYLIQSSLATASTTTGTGAVILAGGLGVAGRGNFGDQVIVTSTAPTAAINAIAGLANVTNTWASGEINGVYGKTTITLASNGSTYSAAGGHFELEFVGNATSGLGMTAACMVKFTSDLEEPNAILYLESYPTGSCDLSETPFITFCDYKSGSGVKSNTLLRIGDPVMAQTISTGAGKISYNGTLRCSIYDDTSSRAIYLVTSSTEGTFTSAYPVALSYAGTALAITSAIPAGDAYSGIRSEVTADDPDNAYGMAGYFQSTVTGAIAGHIYGIGSWINFDSTPTCSSTIIAAQDNGIYGTATLTNTRVIFGMRMEAVITASPAILCPFSINVSSGGITALFAVDALAAVSWTSGVHTSAVSGSLPIICDNDGTTVKYIRTYDTPA